MSPYCPRSEPPFGLIANSINDEVLVRIDSDLAKWSLSQDWLLSVAGSNPNGNNESDRKNNENDRVEKRGKYKTQLIA